MALQKPYVIVFAGPNGSGKSSLTRKLQASGFELGSYINPDDIAAELSGSYEDRVRRAQSIADTRRAESIAAKQSFSFETVFSHPSKLDVMEQARSAGFDIFLFFVGVDDPVINVERVDTRVQTGGHAVPKDRIVARYHRTMALLPEMIARADRAWIFDNSVRMTDAPQFAGRLVADAERRSRAAARGGAGVSQVSVTVRYPLPDWVARYLIAPLRKRPSAVIIE